MGDDGKAVTSTALSRWNDFQLAIYVRLAAQTGLPMSAIIERFAAVKNFYSYCRLVPGAQNSGGRVRHRSSKEGNKYLKIAFSHAATRAIQYFPVVKTYYHRMARKKGAPIARALVAKEIAKSVYFVLQTQEPYNRVFKGMKLERQKLASWPRRASPDS